MEEAKRRTGQPRVGRQYGDVQIIRFLGALPNRQIVWEVRCVCGKEFSARAAGLSSGRVTSCGCVPRRQKEAAPTDSRRKRPEYAVWLGIRRRCSPGPDAHSRYYGRGIRVCDRWMNSFDAFYEDMGPRPSPGHSIDRIDNDGHYEPGNCRWATREEQANNTSRAYPRYEVLGRLYTAAQLAKLSGVRHDTIKTRVRRGWSLERAVSEIPRFREDKDDRRPTLSDEAQMYIDEIADRRRTARK
jgi:hypothetical protein